MSLDIKSKISQQSVRYLCIGIAAFSLEYGSFALLVFWLDSNILVANSLSFIIGLITSFTGNRNWTFQHTSDNSSYVFSAHSQAILYVTLAAVNLLLSNGIVALSASVFGLPAIIAKTIAVGCIVCWNFVIFKQLIFRKK